MPAARCRRLGCVREGGRENTGLDGREWPSGWLASGPEILLTLLHGDGTQAGYDLALTWPWPMRSLSR